MTISFAYWKRTTPTDDPYAYVGGTCRVEDVPDYGTAGTLELPTKVVRTITPEGGIVITSPPVRGTRLSYRYHIKLSAQQALELPKVTETDVHDMLHVQVAPSPHKAANLDNWWWSVQDDFRSLRSYAEEKVPLRLLTAWKGAVLDALLHDHPQRAVIVDAWSARVAAHKGARKRTTPAPKVTPKRENDLVVLPKPQKFTDGTARQVFRYRARTNSGYGRTLYGLYTPAGRVKLPHTNAAPFRDGQAPHPDMAAPIQAALALIAWQLHPLTTVHEVLRSRSQFDALVRAKLAAIPAWSATTPPALAHVHWQAAAAALSSYRLVQRDHHPSGQVVLDTITTLWDDFERGIKAALSTITTSA